MNEPEDQTALLRALRALRWPLAGAVGLAFALARLAEGIFLLRLAGAEGSTLFGIVDALVWGVLAATAVWMVLNWAARQEQRYRAAEASMLAALRESNTNLELLNEINQRLVTRATLDEILDYAIRLPARLVGASAAVLVLHDDESDNDLMTRSTGLHGEELAGLRAAFGIGASPEAGEPTLLARLPGKNARYEGCVLIPLVEPARTGSVLPALGWIEAYLQPEQQEQPVPGLERSAAGNLVLPRRTHNLLVTVAGELAESVINYRRRAREVANLAALEQAIIGERTRIARDLHDGIAQSLAFMRMRVDLWEDWLDQDPEQLRPEFARLKANLRTQIDELRRAIFALRPLELSQLGFEGALRRFVNDFANEQGWDFDLELDELPPAIPPPLELTAFRVVQEALNNSAKHAGATHISVTLRGVDDGLQIVVRDNGQGFDPGAVPDMPGGHLGLRQMRERAAALEGHLTLISRPGEGTEVRVWVPTVYVSQETLSAS